MRPFYAVAVCIYRDNSANTVQNDGAIKAVPDKDAFSKVSNVMGASEDSDAMLVRPTEVPVKLFIKCVLPHLFCCHVAGLETVYFFKFCIKITLWMSEHYNHPKLSIQF